MMQEFLPLPLIKIPDGGEERDFQVERGLNV